MRHATSLRAVALGIVLSSAFASAPTHAQRAQRTQRTPRAPRRACVQFTQHDAADGQSITFEIANRCTMPIEGTVRWRVACGAAGSGMPQEHLEPVRPGQSRILVASASACGGTGVWRIEDISWSWRPQPAE